MSANKSDLAALRRRNKERLDYDERRRLEQDTRHRALYPPKLGLNDEFCPGRNSIWELVQTALQDGLDPNTHWTKEDIIEPSPKFGCLVPGPNMYEYTWRRWNTPLHLALLMRDFESAKIVLRHGGDPNICNNIGRTALHEAVDLQNLDGIRFLVRHGADLDKATEDGLVPLHMALRSGDEELFFALLELGASSQAAAYFQWSIADLALLASERSTLARLMSDEHHVFPTPLLHTFDAPQPSEPTDFVASTEKILAVASSNRLLPEESLYETYHYLLSGFKIPGDQKWDINAVNDLIKTLMGSLHKVSKIPRPALNEQFCSACLEFQSLVLQSCRRGAGTEHNAYPIGLQIHRNKEELDDCGRSGCALCLLAAQTLYRDSNYGWDDIKRETQHPGLLPVFLGLGSSPWPSIGPKGPGSVNVKLGRLTSRGVEFDLAPLETRFAVDRHSSMSRCDDSTTGSAKAMNVARQWLHTCKTAPDHSLCRDAYKGISPGTCRTLPTRVLHVGSEDAEPFLFESNGLKAPYCILSYCWGRPGNAITTKGNLSDRVKCIPLTSLPTLLHQAVLTTRYLGYEYLWIDALCIVQDDPDDWAREASRMHQLYSQADLTITSLTASDSRDSLFESRSRIVRPIPLNLGLPKRDRPNFKEGTVFELAAHPEWTFKRDIRMDGPIHQRAWTLQEQLMSTRVLYFGAGILHWECLHNYLFEPDPMGGGSQGIDQDRRVRKSRDVKLVINGLSQRNGTPGDDLSPIRVWQSQVEEFTRRKLTKPSDRIPAFLAISKTLCTAAGDKFIGGIWTGEHLIQSLCWKLEHASTTDPRGPTWTWASRSGEVSYKMLKHSGKLVPKASVISCNIGADRSHSRIFGSITLKGFFGACEANSRRPGPRYPFPPHDFFDHISESLDSLYIFDVLEFERGPPPTGYGLPAYPNGEPEKIISLLLKPVNDDEDFKTASVFRRVGIAEKADFDREYMAERGYSTEQFRCVTEFETDRVVTIV